MPDGFAESALAAISRGGKKKGPAEAGPWKLSDAIGPDIALPGNANQTTGATSDACAPLGP